MKLRVVFDRIAREGVVLTHAFCPMRETGDPRVDPAYDEWDRFRYFGGRAKM